MAIDGEIYKKGIKGNLTFEEINSLPSEYGFYKQFFKHAFETKNNK